MSDWTDEDEKTWVELTEKKKQIVKEIEGQARELLLKLSDLERDSLIRSFGYEKYVKPSTGTSDYEKILREMQRGPTLR